MSLTKVLALTWGLYLIYHYSRSHQRLDSVISRRDAAYLFVSMGLNLFNALFAIILFFLILQMQSSFN